MERGRVTGQTSSAVLEAFKSLVSGKNVFLVPVISQTIPRLIRIVANMARSLELNYVISRVSNSTAEVRLLSHKDERLCSLRVMPLMGIDEKTRGIRGILVVDPCHGGYLERNMRRELDLLQSRFKYKYNRKGVLIFNMR